MKKFYVFIVVCFFCTAWANAQTYYWVGPSSGSGGLWSNSANWASSSGGAGGAGVPNGSGQNVIIDQNALVNVDVTSITLTSLTVTGNANAILFINSGAVDYTLSLLSTSLVSPALQIDAGSTLTDSADINQNLTVDFANDAKGLVNGTWAFGGSASASSAGATYNIPNVGSLANRLDINGTMTFRDHSLTPSLFATQGYVFFNSGSTLWLDRNGGNAPYATYDASSTIIISSATTVIPQIQLMGTNEIGNLTFNCPAMNVPAGFGLLALPNNLLIKGNVQIQNTNNQSLVIATNGSGAPPFNFTYTVNGNFTISGTSRVAIGRASSSNRTGSLQVNGNFNAGGTSFDLQIGSTINVIANNTTLKLRGNLNHTAGTFNANTTATANTSTDLFTVEMNGSAPQTISSWNGSVDNSTNEVTLLINNAAGVSLSSPVAVGKISWNSAGKGVLTTTSTNVLTINNPGTHSLVVNSADNSGYVSGPVRRTTNTTSSYTMPTGKGGVYHACAFVPNSTTVSVYQAQYFNTSFSDLSFLSPLNGVSNLEYWTASRISGDLVSLVLSLTGTAVPGATGTDDVAVGRYNGSDWVYFSGNLGGSVITPGTMTTGSTGTGPVALNGTFTFVFGPTGALPIELLSFDARKLSSSTAQVSWTVTSNSTPREFVVMASQNGRDFSDIGTVMAQAGQTRYSFVDAHLPSGTTYYRLRLVDIDGSFTLSRVAAVINNSSGVLIAALSPTVVRTTAQLSISSAQSGSMQLLVTDGFGRMVQQMRVSVSGGSQEMPLNFQALPAGVYQITGFMNGQRTQTLRFIKQ